MESYRAPYLLTSLAVVKRSCFDQSTGMWDKVQDENTAIICKRTAIDQDHKRQEMWTQIETQICIELETRRNENLNLKHANMHRAQLSCINNNQVIYMYEPNKLRV